MAWQSSQAVLNGRDDCEQVLKAKRYLGAVCDSLVFTSALSRMDSR
jgi:hypothetical protein